MLSPLLWPQAALTLARTFGFHGAYLRSKHELRRSLGRFRASPVCEPIGPDVRHVFLAVDAERLKVATDARTAVARADRVAAGEYQAYRGEWREMPKDTSGWLGRSIENQSPAEEPWWQIEHLSAGRDIKDVWEPARFAWVYDLVRAYVITGDEQYARTFASYFLSWYKSSPPFRGVHWSCGQEASIRAGALMYAEANFGAGLLDRLGVGRPLYAVLAATGERVADAIDYALSQRNNHGISEAVGLIILGVRFRDAHPEAARWLDTGRKCLTRLIEDQFAPDGWYIQHSFSYLRLAMEQCIIAARALHAVGLAFPATAVVRLRAAANLLLAVINPCDGRVPNHGHNDGAFVHPVTLAEYRDYRPVLTAAAATWRVPMPEGISLDDESLAWLCLDPPSRSEPLDNGIVSGVSGWIVARVGRNTVFMRAGRYKSRPAHLDPLHADVWLDEKEVIVDPGTYAYNAPAPWRNSLLSAAVHNGPLVNGKEPGVRGPRFLWYIWPSAKLTSADFDGKRATIVAELENSVRRTVTVTAEEVVIQDQLFGDGRLSVYWLTHPDADPGALSCDGKIEQGFGQGDAVAGWFSPTYGVKIPTTFVRATTEGAGVTLTARVGLRGETPRVPSQLRRGEDPGVPAA